MRGKGGVGGGKLSSITYVEARSRCVVRVGGGGWGGACLSSITYVEAVQVRGKGGGGAWLSSITYVCGGARRACVRGCMCAWVGACVGVVQQVHASTPLPPGSLSQGAHMRGRTSFPEGGPVLLKVVHGREQSPAAREAAVQRPGQGARQGRQGQPYTGYIQTVVQ